VPHCWSTDAFNIAPLLNRLESIYIALSSQGSRQKFMDIGEKLIAQLQVVQSVKLRSIGLGNRFVMVDNLPEVARRLYRIQLQVQNDRTLVELRQRFLCSLKSLTILELELLNSDLSYCTVIRSVAVLPQLTKLTIGGLKPPQQEQEQEQQQQQDPIRVQLRTIKELSLQMFIHNCRKDLLPLELPEVFPQLSELFVDAILHAKNRPCITCYNGITFKQYSAYVKQIKVQCLQQMGSTVCELFESKVKYRITSYYQ